MLGKIEPEEHGLAHSVFTLTDPTFKEDEPGNLDEMIAGQWTYTGPGVADYIAVKAGNQYAVYSYHPGQPNYSPNTGHFNTADLGGRPVKGLSHLTAYRSPSASVPPSGPSQRIPEPTGLAMLAAGLGAVLLRRPRRA
jgi:hypothetical protein